MQRKFDGILLGSRWYSIILSAEHGHVLEFKLRHGYHLQV